MNIVAQNHTWSEQLSSKISCFMEEFHVGKILKACNAYKVRGFSVTSVFQVAFENVFHNKSFYQQEKMGSSVIPFAKDTFYRFMNSSCVNWRKFTLLLGKAVIQKIVPLTSESRRNVLIIDDSLFSRARSKNVELLSYDAMTSHVSIVFARYMMLSLEQRRNVDKRSIGELFFLAYDELQDLR